jgi:hypothetical protein
MKRLSVAVVAVLLVVGCTSGETSSSTSTSVATATGEALTPIERFVADVPAAVAAVESQRGAPQRYTEINVSPDGVNLFVLTGDGRENVFTYSGGALSEAPEPAAATGEGFAAVDVALDRGPELLDQVRKALPGSRIVTVAIVQVAPEGLVWAVRSQSSKGGFINSLFSPQGKLLSAEPAS